MTDYLEQLLRACDEDEEEPFVWKRVRMGYAGPEGERDEAQLSGEGRTAAERTTQGGRDQKHGGEGLAALGERDRGYPEVPPALAQKADPERQLTALERAVLRGKTARPAQDRIADPERQLAALERAVLRGKMGQIAGFKKQQPEDGVRAAREYDIRRMDIPVSGRQHELAGLLDKAFERDARRYDGPLGLF